MPKCLGSGKEFEVFIEYTDGTRPSEIDVNLVSRAESGDIADRTEGFVEVEHGREFKVIVTSLHPERRRGEKEVMAELWLDGLETEALMFHGKEKTFEVDTRNITRKAKNGRGRDRVVTETLRFDLPDTVEQPEEADVRSSEAADIGEIRVIFFYGTSVRRGPKYRLPAVVALEHGAMWEEDAKNISTIKGGRVIPQSSNKTKERQYMTDPSLFTYDDEVHFHRLILKYATRAQLEVLGIDAPETPEPSKSSAARAQRLPTISTPSPGPSSTQRTPDSGLFPASPLRSSVPPRRSRQPTRTSTILDDEEPASRRSSVLTTASVAKAGRRDEILQALLAEMKDQNAESGKPRRLRPRRTDSPTLTEEVRRRKRQIVDQVREEKRMRLCTQVEAIDRQKRGKRSWQEIDSVFIDLTGDSGDEWEKEEKIEYPDEEEESEVELFEPERIMPRTTRRMARVVKTEQSI